MPGIELVSRLKELRPAFCVIMLTAYMESVEYALRKGIVWQPRILFHRAFNPSGPWVKRAPI